MIASDLNAHDLGSLVLTRRYFHALLTPTLYSRGSLTYDIHGQTPLHWAVAHNQYDTAVRLLSRGADPCAQTVAEKETPLHRAVHWQKVRFVELFLDHDIGASEIKNVDGRTALHTAAWCCYDEIIKVIVAKAPNSIFTTSSAVYMTPLHFATLAGNLRTVALLTSLGADINAREVRGATPLHIAARRGHYKIAKHLIDNNADTDVEETDTGDTPLHGATATPSEEIVQLLLCSGASPTRRNLVGETPLHRALYNGYENLVRVFLEHDDTGRLIEILCGAGQSLLTYAFCGLKPPAMSLIQLLLDHNSNVNFRSISNGHTVLHCAASATDTSFLTLFLKQGANIGVKDRFGSTPLHEAASFGTLPAIEVLIRNGADVNDRDGEGQTPLYCAVERGREHVASLLLEYGADVNAMDVCGMSPLSRACAQCAMHVNPNMVKLLVERGASVRSRDSEGMTALHHASREGHIEVVRLLLKHGALIMEQDKSGDSALDLAEDHSRTDVASLFVETIFRMVCCRDVESFG